MCAALASLGANVEMPRVGVVVTWDCVFTSVG